MVRCLGAIPQHKNAPISLLQATLYFANNGGATIKKHDIVRCSTNILRQDTLYIACQICVDCGLQDARDYCPLRYHKIGVRQERGPAGLQLGGFHTYRQIVLAGHFAIRQGAVVTLAYLSSARVALNGAFADPLIAAAICKNRCFFRPWLMPLRFAPRR
ncbi:hypothetical protein AGR6A_pTi0169 [Agrobacterium sp. NCPPB 925]|nr:hypothetical protein AGR6A_pTi0169 [Agrobacterium sp. NCPPB 925]